MRARGRGEPEGRASCSGTDGHEHPRAYTHSHAHTRTHAHARTHNAHTRTRTPASGSTRSPHLQGLRRAVEGRPVPGLRLLVAPGRRVRGRELRRAHQRPWRPRSTGPQPGDREPERSRTGGSREEAPQARMRPARPARFPQLPSPCVGAQGKASGPLVPRPHSELGPAQRPPHPLPTQPPAGLALPGSRGQSLSAPEGPPQPTQK